MEIVPNISVDVDPDQREAASPLVLVVCGHFHVSSSMMGFEVQWNGKPVKWSI